MNDIKQCHLLFLLDAHEIYTTEILVTYKRAILINVGHVVNYPEASPWHLYFLVAIGNPMLSQKDSYFTS